MQFRQEFDLDPKLIYLNSGTLSITPRRVLEAVKQYQSDYENNPTQSLIDTWPKLWAIQNKVANFFHADPHEFFLRPNVTAALNEFIMGVSIQKEGEILATDLEYGAIVNICRLKAEREGLRFRQFQLPLLIEPLDNEEILKQIISQFRPETKMLLMSHVITGNGFVIPIQKLAEETNRRGILLVVDGAHGPGAVDVDFRKFQNIDFYGGNLHKWMMGPKGTAFGWIPNRNRERVQSVLGGWTTFEIQLPFAGFGDGDLFTARYLMSACASFAPFFALRETIDFWEEFGKEKIINRIKELQDLLINKVNDKLGWPILSPASGPFRGPLLAFEVPSKVEKLGFDLMHQLSREHFLQIMMTPVQGRFRMRLSPHIYNTENEIERAIDLLANKTLV